MDKQELEKFWDQRVKTFKHKGNTIDIFKHSDKKEYISYICDSSESFSYTIKTSFTTIQSCKERAVEFIDKREWLDLE